MEGQIEHQIGTILAERINILEEVIREGTEESVTMGAILLALIGTEASATKLLQLIKECGDDFERQYIIMSAFVGFSPYRYTRKQELLDLFSPGLQDEVILAYDELKELDARIINLPPLPEVLCKAITWVTDDSGD